MKGTRLSFAAIATAVLFAGAVPAGAIHFYRGPGGGCTPASGDLTDQVQPQGPIAASVLMLHNTYHDVSSGSPVTRVDAGQAVRWTWNSAHCHSVSAAEFNSGFHYPTAAPGSPRVLPGLFDYPVPELSPTLSYTRTFTTPGIYTYSCVHHGAIGMAGVVVVEAPGGTAPPAAAPVASIPTPTSVTVFGDNLYASSLATGTVYRMEILPGGGLLPPVAYATGFSSPLGIAFAGDATLFVSDSHESQRPGRTTAGRVWAVAPGGASKQVVIDELPNGRHNTNGMAVKGGRLYITNGNSTDDGVDGGEPERLLSGTLLSVPLATRGMVLGSTPTTGLHVEARGMRNIYDVAFRPRTREAWIPMNGLDFQDPWGEDLLLKVPDVAGGVVDFGFPGCVYAEGFNPNYKQNENPAVADVCDGTQALPEELMGLHTSADGLAFGPSDSYWDGDLFVAEFGNFFGNEVVGHRVVRVRISPSGASSPPEDFLPSAAPLDVTFSGSDMYVADFGAGILLVKPTL